MNGAGDSRHASNAGVGIGQRGRGRRVDDLAVVCSVAAAHIAAGAPVDASGNVSSWQKQIIETVSAAVADTFEHRWHDIPAVPHPDALDGLTDDPSMLPVAQDAPKLALAEPPDLAVASQPEQENPVMVLPKPRTRPSDVCARYGLYRVVYIQDNHRYWRCLHRRRPLPPHAAKTESPAASAPLLSRILSGASLIFQPASP